MPWTCRLPVRLRHSDAAGVIFYPRLFELAQDAYEALIDHLGAPLGPRLEGGGPLLPIAHCEADYLAPIRVGMTLAIEISVVREGKTSFTLGYVFRSEDGAEVARAQTVHVAVEKMGGRPVPLPFGVRRNIATLTGS
ncbi:MAG TPA: acyl-CoA thioesterase [Candidatus Krumholzibacteria bacterium]|nr:acyl-CoA thioesterase [Candidatus Krumholzibacteria bacterium]HPD70298.1 acyl-CoA thioesterase [Candidatus Krumholzibacteria bacterium]HRY40002.1 acyl-CoA thioesterase [Candidatus Krumholzibacteria bacterium]